MDTPLCHIFLNTNTYGPILSQPPSIKSTSCAGGWNSAGLESGRPNPSVSGGRSVCHPPLWAPSSWKRERRDRGWWSYEASGFGGSSCRKRKGTGAAAQGRLSFCSQNPSTILSAAWGSAWGSKLEKEFAGVGVFQGILLLLLLYSFNLKRFAIIPLFF